MAAKAAPAPAAAPAAKEPTEAELVAENKALEAKIAALKQKLGISAAEEEDEKSRVRELFRTFDRDGNGWIDRDEFELLAFQCGSDLSVLTPETLNKTFAAINPKGDGKLTFDDFYKWLKSGAAGDLKGGQKGANLQLLRLKLQSKAWAKRLDNKGDAKAKPAAAGAGAGAAKGAAADAKAAAGAGGKAADAKAAPKAESKVSNFALTLGKFADAKSGVYFSTGENADAAAALRQAVNAPDNTPTFAFIDLNLKPGFDEGQIGELSGIIEALISAVPWQQIPLPIYSSHNVDIVDGEAPNTKALRITLFSGVDLQDLAAGVMGQNGGQPLKDVGKGSMKLELPFGVADLKDPAFRFSAENLKFRLTSEGDIDRNVLAQSQEIVAQMSPQRAWVQGMRNATAQFMKGFDLTLNFSELSDLVAAVPDFDPNAAAAAAAQMAGQPGQVARRGQRPRMPQPSPLQALKAGLAQAAEMPVAMMLDQVLSQVPLLVQQTGQGALYDAVRNNVTGLGRVSVCAHDYIIKLGFKGLDFGLLLPPLN